MRIAEVSPLIESVPPQLYGGTERVVYGKSEQLNSHCLALDGLFPSFFARLHPRLGTPYLGLLFQDGTALVAALVSDLLPLITISVFCASLVYLGTSLAAWRLSPPGAGRIPQAGVIDSRPSPPKLSASCLSTPT